MGFFEAVRVALIEKFATFDGRARRSEYWYFQLFAGIVGGLAMGLIGMNEDSLGIVSLVTLFVFALFVPSLAVTVRRLHDTGRSGWFYLIAFVPLIGGILVFIWTCSRGTEGMNRYGSDPLNAA
ncbi:DUF805 domain-containing protein [Caballeronia sp. LZ062]|uniref:DUF805 domain-containing protein n=1 Tax=unclassified Caballeronia TaxID=2646786 RepID=UPI0028588F9F|nr:MULTISPECIES: DUF805 domain-containing protein [unclassified Caballeronia]MDR5853621.1 DUF805 domain-containing protein [Caballeronia sp. LZ050]MDR5871845.1 DUF805 domain-containing protein [Caballeronia sp. LZ062]